MARVAGPAGAPEGRGWRRVEEPLRDLDLAQVAAACRTLGASGGAPIFLDLETSGLGPGRAVPFVVGLLDLRGAARLVQWLLLDPRREPAMLRDVSRALDEGPEPILVTYNGASFDLPVLRARLSRCGVRSDRLSCRGDPAPHLDLLPAARRLLRCRVPDCRLVTLERALLGRPRGPDLPGREVPEVYARWLAHAGSRERRELDAVVLHNARDLRALARLSIPLARALEHPEGIEQALGAARHHLATGNAPAARRLLLPWARHPDAEQGLVAATFELLARAARATGAREEAARWRALARTARIHAAPEEAGDDPTSRGGPSARQAARPP